MGGGPDGVRTRDRWIKSPSLYLTKLQAHFGLLPRLFNASRRLYCLNNELMLFREQLPRHLMQAQQHHTC